MDRNQLRLKLHVIQCVLGLQYLACYLCAICMYFCVHVPVCDLCSLKLNLFPYVKPLLLLFTRLYGKYPCSFFFHNSATVIKLYILIVFIYLMQWVLHGCYLCQIFSTYGLIEDVYIVRDELKQSRGVLLI